MQISIKNVVYGVFIGLVSAAFAVFLDRSNRNPEVPELPNVIATADYTCWNNNPTAQK
jgi:hypothetical protein